MEWGGQGTGQMKKTSPPHQNSAAAITAASSGSSCREWGRDGEGEQKTKKGGGRSQKGLETLSSEESQLQPPPNT